MLNLNKNILLLIAENGNFNWSHSGVFPAGNYLLKINDKNTITRCEICLKFIGFIFCFRSILLTDQFLHNVTFPKNIQKLQFSGIFSRYKT